MRILPRTRVNREFVRLMVIMEVDGQFPNEVPVFMHNEWGEEIEKTIRVVYHNPPPKCENCKLFEH